MDMNLSSLFYKSGINKKLAAFEGLESQPFRIQSFLSSIQTNWLCWEVKARWKLSFCGKNVDCSLLGWDAM